MAMMIIVTHQRGMDEIRNIWDVSRVDILISQCEEEKKEAVRAGETKREDHRWYFRLFYCVGRRKVDFSKLHPVILALIELLLRVSTMRFFMMNSETVMYRRIESTLIYSPGFPRIFEILSPLFVLSSERPRARSSLWYSKARDRDREVTWRDAPQKILTTNWPIWRTAIALSPSTNDSFAAILDCVSIYLENYFCIRNRYQSLFILLILWIDEKYVKYA